MAAVLEWAGDDLEPVPATFPSSQHRIRGRRTRACPGELPPEIEAALWRGNPLGSPVTSVVASGFPALDAELLRDAPFDEDILELPQAPAGEEILFDYASMGLTLRRHPMALLRSYLDKRRLLSAEQLDAMPNGQIVRYCGIVKLRQQPETANGRSSFRWRTRRVWCR